MFQVLAALSTLIKNAVFEGSTQPTDVVQLFPSKYTIVQTANGMKSFTDDCPF